MRIVYSDHHKKHATENILANGQRFTTEELPERVEIILSALRFAGMGPVTLPTDHGLAPILAVHDPAFVDYLQTIWKDYINFYPGEMAVFPSTFATRSPRRTSPHVEGRIGYYCFGVGSPVLAGTWEAAYWSAQCALTGAQLLRQRESRVYALCRPPGHHAAKDLYGGFCYLNNAAIAARYLDPPVAILDIDFHHGNGTQEIFYRDPQVLFCSLHADPDLDYPYFWGGAQERGEGPGQGYNYNWPLPLGIQDADYLRVLGQALEVIAKFDPQYLVLSAGLDIADGDEVGGFRITPHGFAEIGRLIAGLGKPVLIVQEGGYFLERLGENALALIGALDG